MTLGNKDKPKVVSLRATLRLLLRTAMYAGLARLAFGIIKSLMKGAAAPRHLGKYLQNEVMSTNPAKWAMLMGGLSCLRFVQQQLSNIGLPHSVASFLSGMSCAASSLVMNSTTRTELALYLGVRALHGFATANIWPLLPEVMKKFQHFDVVIMSVTGMQILYCAVFEPQCHSSAYQTFLVNCTMQDQRVLNATAGLHRNQIVPDMVCYAREKGFPIPTDTGMKQLCNYYHKGTSCNGNMFKFAALHMLKFSLPLYVPLKVVTTLLFSWKKCVKQPLVMIKKVLTSASTSALFLSLYVVVPFRLVCLFSSLGIRSAAAVGILSGAISGLPTLLEPKSRRMDLALFCGMHALRSQANLSYIRGLTRKATRYDAFLMYAVAIGYIFYQFDVSPEILHPNIRSGIAWLLKEPHHSPSHRTHGHHHHKEEMVTQKE